jgi:uncharacterized protein YjbI with pentapeptide repeats
MANSEHLKLLKENIDAWNDWRKNNPELQPDLEDADLRGSNLCRANLRGALLCRSNLQNANLCQANLEVEVTYTEYYNPHNYHTTRSVKTTRFTDLCNANLRNANLSRAKLKGSLLVGADLRGANLDGAKLQSYICHEYMTEEDAFWLTALSTDLSFSNLSDLDLTKAILSSSEHWCSDDRLSKSNFPNFRGANLDGSNLKNVNLSNADFSEAKLCRTNFSRANLSEADLTKANLQESNLTESNLSQANLQKTDLSKAQLSRANLSQAKLQESNLQESILTGADLSQANLQKSNLRKIDLSQANLSQAKLQDANLQGSNLTGAELVHANLDNANLRKANLTATDLRRKDLQSTNISSTISRLVTLSDTYLNGKDLSGVDFSGSNLSRIQALGTNFSEAIMTGACIEDWHINYSTNLDGVICDYIYLKNNQQERRPHDQSKMFTSGEFAKLFQKAIETVDLIFRNGINWEAFAYSFHQLQVKVDTEDVSIQTIENKGDGNFVIRVSAPLGSEKIEIQRFLEQMYQESLKAIENKYRIQLQTKDEQLDIFRQENTNLWEMAKLMASRPINVETKAVIDNQSKNVEVEMNFQASVTGATGVNKGVMNINASERQKTLAESAAEIQRLLKQLEDTNPLATVPEQIAYVNQATKPDLKQRAIGALKEAGDVAIEEFFLENKYLKIGKAVVKGWLQGTA